ncbi:MAG: hydroxyisourate hydrolase [Gammaproteobacteria bacterium]|nr:hydroxyisourate hydrolase [Gammaproteobacteria bacterium]
MKSAITTHILDVNLGKPAANVNVVLYKIESGDHIKIAESETNEDGRIIDWMGDAQREAGVYRITFDTDGYFNQLGERCFYPSVSIDFKIEYPAEHYHVPLLISAHGYSTYRGS